jgi:hypothetical protein
VAKLGKIRQKKPTPTPAKQAKQPRATLTLKQKLFVEAYIGPARGNGKEAARRAGYAGNDATLAQVATENLKRPQILALINSRVEEVAMTADEILTELADIARLPCPGPDASHKLKALELLGKHYGLFSDKREHTVGNLEIIVTRADRRGTTTENSD